MLVQLMVYYCLILVPWLLLVQTLNVQKLLCVKIWREGAWLTFITYMYA